MISFVKGIIFDQANKILKLLQDLKTKPISPDLDSGFLAKTIMMLQELLADIESLAESGDLDLDALNSNNIIKYNTYHERLLNIELFRYLIIMNYGEPEIYFKKKIVRIYKEINSLQSPPLITTISNSENYYWALPSYDIIAVPTGEERSLLNLPDLYHEMGHLIYNQSDYYLKQDIEDIIDRYYRDESQRVINEDRPSFLIGFYREKYSAWVNAWIMEFTCDLIATFLVGPAYAWTNLKLTTLSSADDRIFQDSASHPSDESRMRAIFYMLKKMGHNTEVTELEKNWSEFLTVTNNPVPQYYAYVFPQHIIEQLADYVFEGCKAIDLKVYSEQVAEFTNPIPKILNDAWLQILNHPESFQEWEKDQIALIQSA